MASLLNVGRVLVEKGPYDAEIEYLESTGTQYIIIPVPQGELIKLLFVFNESVKNQLFCGSWKNSAADYPSFSIDGYDRIYCTNMTTGKVRSYAYGFKLSEDIYLEYKEGTIITNGIVKHTDLAISVDYQSDLPFRLFSIYYGWGTAYANGLKVKRFKIVTVNGAIDIIPVRIGQTGYMYDKVSGQLFGNSGTGNFILGPDK